MHRKLAYSIGYQLAFQDAERVKYAWFGTYYHGTTPEAEKSILQEGFRPELGGKGSGASQELANIGERVFGLPSAGNWATQQTAGKTTLSRSKWLAKMYGGWLDPTTLEASGGLPGKIRAGLRNIITHQPLEVSGLAGHRLTIDPGEPVLAVQTTKKIPANLVRKSAPDIVERATQRVLESPVVKRVIDSPLWEEGAGLAARTLERGADVATRAGLRGLAKPATGAARLFRMFAK